MAHPTLAATAAALPTTTCRSCGPAFGASVGRVVARIDGALGSAILVGLDRVAICRCSNATPDDRFRPPFLYDDLAGADLHHYGSLPVVMLHLANRPDPLPILVLERDQIGAALDGLVTLRRLISLAGRPAIPAHPEAAAATATTSPTTGVS